MHCRGYNRRKGIGDAESSYASSKVIFMPAGFTIRVTTQPGSAGAPIQEFFQVAIHEKNRAVEVPRRPLVCARRQDMR